MMCWKLNFLSLCIRDDDDNDDDNDDDDVEDDDDDDNEVPGQFGATIRPGQFGAKYIF